MKEGARCTAGRPRHVLRFDGQQISLSAAAAPCLARYLAELDRQLRDVPSRTPFDHADGCERDGDGDEIHVVPAAIVYGPAGERLVIEDVLLSDWAAHADTLARQLQTGSGRGDSG